MAPGASCARHPRWNVSELAVTATWCALVRLCARCPGATPLPCQQARIETMLDPSASSGESKSVACAEELGQLVLLLWKFRLTSVLGGPVATSAQPHGGGTVTGTNGGTPGAANGTAHGVASKRCDTALSFVRSDAFGMLVRGVSDLDKVVVGVAVDTSELGDAEDSGHSDA